MRVYTVQPGDSPASIARNYAGCPKCARDLIAANPHKASVEYENGYVTFREMYAGEKLNLPEKWFDGTLDGLPPEYFASLPSADGMLADPRPNQPPTGCSKDYVLDTDPQSITYNQCVYAPVPLKPDFPRPIFPLAPVSPLPPHLIGITPVTDPSKNPPNAGGGTPGGGGGGGIPGGGTPGETTPSESGMSTGAKIALALGITAAGGGIAWALTR